MAIEIATLTPPPLIIIGAGGHAREMVCLARDCGTWNLLGCVDDAPAAHGRSVAGAPVLGTIEEAVARRPDANFLVAIGDPRIRKNVVTRLAPRELRFATLIHPAIIVPADLRLGHGSTIGLGSVLSTNVSIGDHVIVNVSCTLSHDVQLGDFSTVGPGLTLPGEVCVGRGAEIAPGAAIARGIQVGVGAMVGLGAVVTRSIPDNVLAYGAPARSVRALDPF